MSPSNRKQVFLSLAVLLLFSLCCSAAFSEVPTGRSDQPKFLGLRTDLKKAQAEAEMIAKHVDVGVASQRDLQDAEVKVQSLQARLARHEKDWTRALDALRKVVALQEDTLNLQRRRHAEGIVPLDHVDLSQVALSRSRILYELMTVISIRQREIDRKAMEVQAGIAGSSQLLRAEGERDKACGLYDSVFRDFDASQASSPPQT